MCEPWPRTMYRGSPPTARKARTGEFTPPGINCSARFCSLRDCSVLRAIVPPQQRLSPGASDTPINITAAPRWSAAQSITPTCDPGYRGFTPKGLPGPREAESNSSDFHETAILLQSLAAILMAVALLTGRVYQDGLGGLRAVLF